MPAISLHHEDFYPSSDGKPVAESDLHQREMLDLIAALRDRYRSAPDIYVAGNNLLYYVRGDRGAVISPDVYVVKGVPKGLRKSYKLWEEGVGPCFVIEVTSESTRDDDLRRKLDLYERLGVEEYFLHDPLGDYLSPPLQGYRLAAGPGGKYRTIVPERDGSLTSRTTNLRLRREGESLRLVDLASGTPLPTIEESLEEIRRLAAENDRLRRELESLRSDQE
ncbi:MAG TPA: Uma2 family endonuclease [Thermoanaerobaculia bacterium]|nr:Uma2 family endonuclease [Thermoanaerobaculia bacterium]